jgi:deazaflavin-dependent oxidoreductase (nitroreductase family)
MDTGAVSRATTPAHASAPTITLGVTDRTTGVRRYVSVARVEADGSFAAIAVLGSGPENLEWFADVLADPRVSVHDGSWRREMTAREVFGYERDLWWQLAERAGAVHDDAIAVLAIRVFCLEAPELVVLPDPEPTIVLRQQEPNGYETPIGEWPDSSPQLLADETRAMTARPPTRHRHMKQASRWWRLPSRIEDPDAG